MTFITRVNGVKVTASSMDELVRKLRELGVK